MRAELTLEEYRAHRDEFEYPTVASLQRKLAEKEREIDQLYVLSVADKLEYEGIDYEPKFNAIPEGFAFIEELEWDPPLTERDLAEIVEQRRRWGF